MLRIALARTHLPSRALRPLVLRPAVKPTVCFARFKHQLPDFWTSPVVTYEQVKSRAEQPSPDAYLVDVREPDEVILGSIPSSVNIPLSKLAEALHTNPEAFKEKYGFEKPQSSQEIVFYCRTGKRSATAGDIAKRHGYSNVLNYEGSWMDWSSREKQ